MFSDNDRINLNETKVPILALVHFWEGHRRSGQEAGNPRPIFILTAYSFLIAVAMGKFRGIPRASIK